MSYKPAILQDPFTRAKINQANRVRKFRHYHSTQMKYCLDIIKRAQDELTFLQTVANPQRAEIIRCADLINKTQERYESHVQALRTMRARPYRQIADEVDHAILESVETTVKELANPNLTTTANALLPAERDEFEEYLQSIDPEELRQQGLKHQKGE